MLGSDWLTITVMVSQLYFKRIATYRNHIVLVLRVSDNPTSLEALACGVPVVQPDHGAYPEWIHASQGGLLHRPNDSVDLAEKLATLLRDANLRKKLGMQGRQNIFEKFSSERMASATLDVFRALMNKNPTQESSKFPLDAFTSLA